MGDDMTDKTGPLPEPDGELWEFRTPRNGQPFRYHTADQLRAYGDARVAAERERCARIAEGLVQTRDWVPGSLYDNIRREVAARIRRT